MGLNGKRLLAFATVLAVVGFLIFRACGPLQGASVVVWTGLVAALVGAVCVVKPVRFLGIGERRVGAVILLGGAAAVAAALLWPSPAIRIPRRQTSIDEFVPEYHFNERHAVLVHVPPERVTAVWKKVTLGELGYTEQLLRLRAIASGRFRSRPRSSNRLLSGAGRLGIRLREGEREIVAGMVGTPWSATPGPLLKTPEEFVQFRAPGSVKIAYDMRVEDAGNGWSRLTSETRVVATDDSARRIMACYWRVIYPGSSIIRRWWLEAIQRRAEASS